MTSTKIEKLNFRYKKSRLRDNPLFIFKMVPEARLELARLERRGILNPLCLPIPPLGQIGAGNEARTRDPDLGKVVLYQLSYSRRAFM